MIELLHRVKTSSVKEDRRRLWAAARRQLLSHERGEALEVHSALEGYDAARSINEQHARQASELESIINELDAIDPASAAWSVKLLDVVALFEEHVRDEELEFFPRAEEILGENAARELEQRYASAQQEIAAKLL